MIGWLYIYPRYSWATQMTSNVYVYIPTVLMGHADDL